MTSPYPPKVGALGEALASLMGQAFLVNRSPEEMLFTFNSNENFIDEECISISPMFLLQLGSIFWAKLNAPQSDRIVSDIYSALRYQIFIITMTEIESIVEPNRVLDNYGWKSKSFVII